MEKTPVLESQEALSAIQAIAGLSLLVLGVYIFGPWYVVIPDSASFSTVIQAASVFVQISAALQAITGAGMIYGAIRGNNIFSIITIWGGVSMYSLIVAMRLITIGPVPIVWVPQLALMLVCAVLALSVRRR